MAKSQHKTGIFFFDNPHHIYHAASIAFELAKIPNQDVAIYCSTNINYETSVSLAKRYLGENFIIDFPNLSIELVLPSLFYRITRYFKKRPFPGRASVFNRHQDKFLSCDTLASPADAILKLKKQKKFLDKSFVYTHHGAGDREYGFMEWVDEFDLVFVSSHEIKARFEKLGIAISGEHEKLKVIGYPKFDLCLNNFIRPSLFNNTKPIVLYNPHFEKEFSSWFHWGHSIIDYFSRNSDFNLIVAPHINLADKEKEKIKRYSAGKENIYVDVDINSSKLVDMTYTLSADIYLGDVSSQVYEFLVNEKPCLFLNPNNFQWKGDPNFQCWNYGDVLESFENFDELISSSIDRHSSYLNIQKKAFEKRFYKSTKTSSQLAAELLVKPG